MSRSYKKAILKDGEGGKKWAKRQASKAVRRYKGEIPNGGAYKKLYESYDIDDYIYDGRWEPKMKLWFFHSLNKWLYEESWIFNRWGHVEKRRNGWHVNK